MEGILALVFILLFVSMVLLGVSTAAQLAESQRTVRLQMRALATCRCDEVKAMLSKPQPRVPRSLRRLFLPDRS